MTNDAEKPVVRLKPSGYQPSTAELEEDVRVDTTPDALVRAATATVKVERVKPS